MRRLSRLQWEKALEYIRHHGREIEKQLAAFHLEGGSREAVLEELEKYRNPDGGFGRTLEPDARYDGSSVLGTTTALRLMLELEVPPDQPMVLSSDRFLLEHYQPHTLLDLPAARGPIRPPGAVVELASLRAGGVG